MSRKLTDEQYVETGKMLIEMGISKETRLEVYLVINTEEELLLFLDKLAAKNYEMTSEEVYQALVDTLLELQ